MLEITVKLKLGCIIIHTDHTDHKMIRFLYRNSFK